MRFHKLSVFAAYEITFIGGEIGILSHDDELLTIPLEGGQKHFFDFAVIRISLYALRFSVSSLTGRSTFLLNPSL